MCKLVFEVLGGVADHGVGEEKSKVQPSHLKQNHEKIKDDLGRQWCQSSNRTWLG